MFASGGYQIVCTSKDGEVDNFLVSLRSKDSLIRELRGHVAKKFGVEKISRVRLEFEGCLLSDEGTLEEFSVPSLSTVTVSVAPDTTGRTLSEADDDDVMKNMTSDEASSTKVSDKGENAAAAVISEDDVLIPEELQQSVVVTGIPSASRESTRKAILDHFNAAGRIRRIILQSDEDETEQHAVIVFGSSEGAQKAAKQDQTKILGAIVRITAVSQLSTTHNDNRDVSAEESFAKGKSQGEKACEKIPDSLINLFARGCILGKKGIAHVERFEKSHQITQRVNIAAKIANERFEKIDREHRVTDRLREGLTRAASITGSIWNSAKPGVTRTVNAVNSTLSPVASVVGRAAGQTQKSVQGFVERNEVRERATGAWHRLSGLVVGFGGAVASKVKTAVSTEPADVNDPTRAVEAVDASKISGADEPNTDAVVL
eukprot:g3377.t1